MKDEIKKILLDKLDHECSDQVDLNSFITRYNFAKEKEGIKILDLGCGDGRARPMIRKLFPKAEYCGVDIEFSPEVSGRNTQDNDFYTYDGVNIPFPSDTFDVIYSKQVLEHVRHPDALIKDAVRVLKPGGVFLGSVSQLEPYHSYSIFNWTAYGIVTVFEDNGAKVSHISPGIDGVTLTLRRMFRTSKFNSFFASESLFNHFLENGAFEGKNTHFEKNFIKVLCAGHLVFSAVKVERPD